MLGDNYFPGSSITMRVDKNSPLSWKVKDRHKPLYDQAIAIEQMMSGTKVLARYTKWPQKTYDTGEFSLNGFAEALLQAWRGVMQR